MARNLTPGYTENMLLWDQEDGTVSPDHREGPSDAITFRRHWGVDRTLSLPDLPAWAANRYLDALRDLAAGLAEYATMEYNYSSDGWKIVYSGDYQPHMNALFAVVDHVAPTYEGLDELEWEAEKGIGYDEQQTKRGQARIAARIRALRAERTRDLIVEGDGSHTPAEAGKVYTTIRVEAATGHVSAHTAEEAAEPGHVLAAMTGTVRTWAVGPLNPRQANTLMKRVRTDALRIANPNAPGVLADEAEANLVAALEAMAPANDAAINAAVTASGKKPTAKARARAARTLATKQLAALVA